MLLLLLHVIMMRKVTYLFVSIFISTCVYSQTESEAEYVNDNTDYVISYDSLKTKDKLHFGFETGASFGNSNSFGNYFSTYYKPSLTYDFSPRLALKAGFAYANSSVNNYPNVSDNNYKLFSGNISQYYAFVEAEYKLSNKLSVGGSLFYDFSSYNSNNGYSINSNSGLENLGYSAYFKYKANKHLTIEGEIRINDKNPYNQSSSFIDRHVGVGNSYFGR